MLNSDSLKDALHRKGLTQKDQILLVLAVEVEKPKLIPEIRQLAVSSGLRAAQKWNISAVLAKARGIAIRLNDGWILTAEGREYLSSEGLIPGSSVAIKNVMADLRQHIQSISNAHTKNFLEEAVSCLERDLFRAAVVLSWVGAVSLLYDYVIQNHLGKFNAEASRRDKNWRNATTTDELARMKEHDFLNVLEAISVIGKNVKQELQNCLTLRNGCGHPNSLKIGQQRAAAHVETLILNVFSKF